MKTLFFLTAFLFSFSFGFSSPGTNTLTQCPAPTNITVASQTATSVSFDWDDCGCTYTEFQVYFVKDGQTSSVHSSSSSDIAFSGLASGTYQFYFYTVCGGELSSIIIEDIFLG